MDKTDVIYLYHRILFSHEQEGYPAIWNNIDGHWAHYAKWDNADKERQVLYICGIENSQAFKDKINITNGSQMVATSRWWW